MGGVEVTKAKVRRERMGHIELAAPVSHIWYFRGVPSRISLMADISPKELEQVLYFVSHIVLDPGEVPEIHKKQVLTDREYRELCEKYGSKAFRVGMGAEAIKELLIEIDLDKESKILKDIVANSVGQKRLRAVKRLEIVEAFRISGNRPEWMILDVIPVLPPELRPMIQLDGGRFATSDLNDLYRRVINRNNRLKHLKELGAPDTIIHNEKRMLQEAVDALIDNGRRGKAVTGSGNFGDSLGKSINEFGKRFTFGGEPSKDQRIYYFNTKEITGNKYGTPSPVPFRVVDQRAGIDIDIAIRCFGEYSYRVANPLLFYTNVCGNVSEDFKTEQIAGQMKTELLTARKRGNDIRRYFKAFA